MDPVTIFITIIKTCHYPYDRSCNFLTYKNCWSNLCISMIVCICLWYWSSSCIFNFAGNTFVLTFYKYIKKILNLQITNIFYIFRNKYIICKYLNKNQEFWLYFVNLKNHSEDVVSLIRSCLWKINNYETHDALGQSKLDLSTQFKK